jgi:hypothetical protein
VRTKERSATIEKVANHFKIIKTLITKSHKTKTSSYKIKVKIKKTSSTT